MTINQACASGLRAITLAYQQILLGEARCVLAGGMESMSNTPYLLPGARRGYRFGHHPLVDGMYQDGFDCPLCNQRMGETAENLAELYKISRAEQDAFALTSQQRCEAARQASDFAAEIEPVELPGQRGPQRIEHDEHPRDGVTLEGLAKLPAVFREAGGVTAGNSSGITDGAAALLVLSHDRARELGVAPWAKIRSFAVVGVEPHIMGIGPVPATRRALERAGMKLEDIDLIEINEAFAAQVLACQRELGYDPERANIAGGAIALGHPIGCSGARILVTLLHAMRRRGAATGLATLCVSGGQGLSLIVEAI
jgi:acetyl-CoA C-acetyltransferase